MTNFRDAASAIIHPAISDPTLQSVCTSQEQWQIRAAVYLVGDAAWTHAGHDRYPAHGTVRCIAADSGVLGSRWDHPAPNL